MISKPLLGLIIILEHNYREVLEFVVTREIKEYEIQQQVFSAFDSLMSGIDRTFEAKNKDKFSSNFGVLRKALVSIR
jgi:hypothetical protein